MCDISLAWQWWVVAGLIADIAGVTILAVEVFLGTYGASGFLRESEDPAAGIRLMGPAPIDDLDGRFSLNVEGIPEQIRTAFVEIEDWIARREFIDHRLTPAANFMIKSTVPRRRRLLVSFGALFLIAGFALQIIGAWPCQ